MAIDRRAQSVVDERVPRWTEEWGFRVDQVLHEVEARVEEAGGHDGCEEEGAEEGVCWHDGEGTWGWTFLFGWRGGRGVGEVMAMGMTVFEWTGCAC